MSENLFRNNFPHVFRIEYEVCTDGGRWEKRWVLMVARDFSDAWTSFPKRLNPEAYALYKQGRIRLLGTSSGLLLDVEYQNLPDFDMPIDGVPNTYYPMRQN
jgi:hypothetical protein